MSGWGDFKDSFKEDKWGWANPVGYGMHYPIKGQFESSPTEHEMSPWDMVQFQQQQAYMGQLQQQAGQTSPYQANSEYAMNNALMGNSYQGGPQGMDQGQVEDYYQSTLHNPAVRQYENTTRPAWLENVGNVHSGHRMEQERRGYEDLYSGLDQQRGNLMWQNTLRNQNLQQHSANMNMQGQMQALGMMPQLDPQMRAQMMYQQMMMGQDPTVTTTPPGPSDAANFMGPLAGMMGAGGSVLQGVGSIYGGGM
ncbi:MAG: hypothetical protein GY861_01775 [bacterium]|nr:hypothetical protein [bacterium]